MSKKKGKARSVAQLVANRGRNRRMTRDDAFTAYAIDRLLYRLGRSRHAKELYLKVASSSPTWLPHPIGSRGDIDVARRHGPCDPDDLRQRFREIVAVPATTALRSIPTT